MSEVVLKILCRNKLCSICHEDWMDFPAGLSMKLGKNAGNMAVFTLRKLTNDPFKASWYRPSDKNQQIYKGIRLKTEFLTILKLHRRSLTFSKLNSVKNRHHLTASLNQWANNNIILISYYKYVNKKNCKLLLGM